MQLSSGAWWLRRNFVLKIKDARKAMPIPAHMTPYNISRVSRRFIELAAAVVEVQDAVQHVPEALQHRSQAVRHGPRGVWALQ